MGRYWALSLLSVVLRVLAVLTLGGYFYFWGNQVVISSNPETANSAYAIPQLRQADTNRPDNAYGTPELDALYSDLLILEQQSYQLAYFGAIVILIMVVVGWPLLALILYAAGQWINLHIDSEWNTRRVADRADAAGRRVSLPARPKTEDEKFWDEQVARQRTN